MVEDLTPRELEVIALVAQGNSNREIATELCISSNTVKQHMTRILRKTGHNNRTELAVWAWHQGVLSD